MWGCSGAADRAASDFACRAEFDSVRKAEADFAHRAEAGSESRSGADFVDVPAGSAGATTADGIPGSGVERCGMAETGGEQARFSVAAADAVHLPALRADTRTAPQQLMLRGDILPPWICRSLLSFGPRRSSLQSRVSSFSSRYYRQKCRCLRCSQAGQAVERCCPRSAGH